MDGAWRAWQTWVRNVVSNIPGSNELKQLQLKLKGKQAVRGVTAPTKTFEMTKTQTKKLPPPAGEDLKTAAQPRNKARLRRDLTRLRRPRPKFEKLREREQLKRINPKLTNLKVPPKTYEEKLVRRVDPPKPFDIDEQYLETPKERKGRMEREKSALKSPCPLCPTPHVQMEKTFIIFEPWYPEALGSPPGFRERD